MSVLSTWDELEDGLLGITVRGDRCFRVEKTDIKDDNLCVFEITAKQALLEMDNALHRLDYMQVLLEKINARETNQS